MDEVGQLNEFMNMVTLEGEHCHLKHSEEDPSENHPAVNYLCQFIGFIKEDIAEYMIQIPVCKECEEALTGDGWVLFYCITCNSSQWVLKSLAKRIYKKTDKVFFMDVCPICTEENNVL